LILIGVGVIFLLRNTGLVSGDLLNSLLPYWPVLLILMGLDSIYRKEGWIGSTLVIALGVVFLLSNLGYLALSAWQVLLRLWPLFLVAAGFDILIGKRSWLGSLLGLLVILAILAGSLWVIGGGVFSVRMLPTTQLEQALEGVSQARIEINQDAGSMRLGASDDNDMLLVGVGPVGEGLTFTKDFQVQDGVGNLVLRGKGELGPTVNTNQYAYNYQLNSKIPIELITNQGAGEINLGLENLHIVDLDVDQAVGQISVFLPELSLSGSINGAIGQVNIIAPANVGLKVVAGTALVSIQTPADFDKANKVYTSSNYEQAEIKIDLQVNLAIGNVNIEVR
jgi:hypothetical protein